MPRGVDEEIVLLRIICLVSLVREETEGGPPPPPPSLLLSPPLLVVLPACSGAGEGVAPSLLLRTLPPPPPLRSGTVDGRPSPAEKVAENGLLDCCSPPPDRGPKAGVVDGRPSIDADTLPPLPPPILAARGEGRADPPRGENGASGFDPCSDRGESNWSLNPAPCWQKRRRVSAKATIALTSL